MSESLESVKPPESLQEMVAAGVECLHTETEPLRGYQILLEMGASDLVEPGQVFFLGDSQGEAGDWMHYKGEAQVYVIGRVVNCEGSPFILLYYDDNELNPKGLWMLPTEVFHDEAEFEGSKVPRFRRINRFPI